MPASTPPEADAASEAERLASTLEGLRDPALRLSWTRDALTQMGAARASDVLTVVLQHAEDRRPQHTNLLLMVSVALYGDAQRELRRAIASLAEIRRQRALSEFLREPEDAPIDAPRASHAPYAGGERALTLGEQKSLARRRDRSVLAKALREPHPEVIRILLDNPALTETDVLRLCALRPVMPEVLERVFQSPRWVVRYRVRLTMALNPYTPELLALQLLPHLTESDRREVGRSGQLSERVRQACERRPSDAPLH